MCHERAQTSRRLGMHPSQFGKGVFQPKIPMGKLGRDTMRCSASDAMIPIEITEKRVQLTDVIDWFINLPWPKMASWIFVIGIASQLKEFLGVWIM